MVSLTVQVDESLFNRLKLRAEDEHKSIEEVLVEIVRQEVTETSILGSPSASDSVELILQKDYGNNALLMLAEAMEAAGYTADEDNLAEQSRTILDSEQIS